MIWFVPEVPAVRLTRSVKAVMSALAASSGQRLAVAHVARDARLAPSTVRAALAELEKGRLVRHTLAPGYDLVPPRLVYWLTSDGVAVATGHPRV